MAYAKELIAKLKRPGAPYTPDYFELENDEMIWNASLVLLQYLQDHKNGLRGKRVLELGSGLGHLAVGLSRAGAHVTCTERPKCLGELISSIDKQQAERTDAQRAEHEALGGSIESVELEWGQDAWPQSPLSRKGAPKFDAIILAEVVYNTNFHDMLMWTIKSFTHQDIEIYSVLVDRPFSFAFFSIMGEETGYDVQEVKDFDALGMDEELVCMHLITPLKQ